MSLFEMLDPSVPAAVPHLTLSMDMGAFEATMHLLVFPCGCLLRQAGNGEAVPQPCPASQSYVDNDAPTRPRRTRA